MFFSLTWEAIGANTSSMERVCTSEERSIVGRSSGFMSASSLRLDPPLEYAQVLKQEQLQLDPPPSCTLIGKAL